MLQRPIPLVSFVTVHLNQADALARTFAGCDHLVGSDWEHVVIDGASDDGSVDLIARRAERGLVRTWRSEPDRGIAHAFNKGIALARGRWIVFLSAGDVACPGAVAVIAGIAARRPDVELIAGAARIGADPATSLTLTPDPHWRRGVARRMPDLVHQALFARREVFARCGGFNERWRLAMDYEWLLRAARCGVRCAVISPVLTIVDDRGISKRRYWRAQLEASRISLRGGYPLGSALLHGGLVVLKTGARTMLETLGVPSGPWRQAWRRSRLGRATVTAGARSGSRSGRGTSA